MLLCIADLIAFAGLLAAVVVLPAVWAKLLAGSLLGLSIARLFVIGHDACHQAFFTDRSRNRWIGRLVFLPSLTNYSLWEVGHNLGHHGYTNLRGYDYVWTPRTKAEYDAMPPWRRALERFYRSGFGLGAYYAVELWWKTLLFPSAQQRARAGASFGLDSWLVGAFAAAWLGGLLAAALLTGQSPALLVLCGFLLPFALWNLTMGAVIYFHHTHPDVAWFDDIDLWAAQRDGTSGTVLITFPSRLGMLLNNIMQHPVHHLDVRIPLYNLGAAQAELNARTTRIVTQPFGPTHVLETLRRCKLYDYEARRWTDFDGVSTTPALAERTEA
ncbi:MAG: fatty acid desaturase, partial [Pseudomonadales bacterium]|nr:fatty acid desaturase [Pseudomonadales bacterium]